jgi:hypothetical protein
MRNGDWKKLVANLDAFEHLERFVEGEVGELLIEPAQEDVVSPRAVGVLQDGLLVLLAEHESQGLDELVHPLLRAARQGRPNSDDP